MKSYKLNFILLFAFYLCFLPVNNVFAGMFAEFFTLPETDNSRPSEGNATSLFYAFDLRDRESFIQLTFVDQFNGDTSATAHVQIFNVADNCNENDFFDVYTISDTHVYNMRDIQTNDGNPSGVVLPDGAYGIVVINLFRISAQGTSESTTPMGNLRILDDNGYEYRTNAQRFSFTRGSEDFDISPIYTFNFNMESGINLSDIIGVTVNLVQIGPPTFLIEWNASDPLSAFNPFDIDIVDNEENIFSCRDVTFACVNNEHPLLEELLELSGTNVASFEYGINNAIPHSKGGELLCPGNTISEGIVTLQPEPQLDNLFPYFFGFIALNNGNGRGSMDSPWVINFCESIINCAAPPT